MKQKAGITICYLAALIVAVGCTKELPETSPQDHAALQVIGIALEKTPDAGATSPAKVGTRAVEINETFTFADGDELSLFMRGVNYDNVDNRQVTYSKPGADAGTWAIGGDAIYLHSETAIVSMVYPYVAAGTITNIPFTTGAYSTDKDLLWKQQDVYYAASQARVELMKHALTRVKFIIKRDDPTNTATTDHFVGAGAVTAVGINNGIAAGAGVNAAVFTGGVLNLSFMAPAQPVSGTAAGAVADATAFTLSTTGHTTDLLTLPIAALVPDLVTLNVTVDGVTLTTPLPFAAPAVPKWEAGTCYTYTVTIKSKGIEITSSVVDNWTTGKPGDNDVEVPKLSPYIIEYGKAPFAATSGDFRGTPYTIPAPTSESYNGKPTGTYYTTVELLLAGEPPYKKFEVAPANENGGAEVKWQPALDACAAKAPAGQWRVPRQSELMLMYLNRAALEATDGFTAFSDYYWSATEFNTVYSWFLYFSFGHISKADKIITPFPLRCVREIK